MPYPWSTWRSSVVAAVVITVVSQRFTKEHPDAIKLAQIDQKSEIKLASDFHKSSPISHLNAQKLGHSQFKTCKDCAEQSPQEIHNTQGAHDKNSSGSTTQKRLAEPEEPSTTTLTRPRFQSKNSSL